MLQVRVEMVHAASLGEPEAVVLLVDAPVLRLKQAETMIGWVLDAVALEGPAAPGSAVRWRVEDAEGLLRGEGSCEPGGCYLVEVQ